jgi:hypothetical protein
VLPRASYQHLIELLEQPAIAKLIYHVDSLGDEYISLLHSAPAPLRKMVARAANDNLIRLEGLVDGLRFLADRGAAPSFDALVADLAPIRQPTQLIARIANLVQQLPLPDPIPPAMVGGAHRLDAVAEIRRLAKDFRNCVASAYLDSVNSGHASVYFWPHRLAPAACVVSRHGRLGWALEAAKGPQNVDLPPARQEEIDRAFKAVGIPGAPALEALGHAGHALELLRLHRPARRRRDADYGEIHEEFEEIEASVAAVG